MISRLVASLFLLSAISPAAAADVTLGIAFAYAPEQGSGVCTGATPAEAFACATNKCKEGGAAAEDCIPVTWCMPANWSVGVGVMQKEGPHWSEFSCGWPTRDAAIAAGRLKCEQQDKNFILECNVGTVYDPNGKEEALEN